MKALAWLRWCLSFDVMMMIVAIIGFVQVYGSRRRHSSPISSSLKEVFHEMAPALKQGLSSSRMTLYKPKPTGRKLRWNKHEERCREIFQDIFHQSFPNVRPDFLISPITGCNLELDGYCPEILTPLGKGLAFEYDGVQHAKLTPAFHSNPYKFAYQVEKDKIKNQLCQKNKILLIRIPNFVAYHDLDRYIRTKLEQHGLGR